MEVTTGGAVRNPGDGIEEGVSTGSRPKGNEAGEGGDGGDGGDGVGVNADDGAPTVAGGSAGGSTRPDPRITAPGKDAGDPPPRDGGKKRGVGVPGVSPRSGNPREGFTPGCLRVTRIEASELGDAWEDVPSAEVNKPRPCP